MQQTWSVLLLVVAACALGACGSGRPTLAATATRAPVTPPLLASTETPSPTPVLPAQIEDAGATMVLVAAGQFVMGSSEDEISDALAACERITEACDEQGFDSEAPQHTVTLNSFYIDQFEVTNAQFATFLNEVGNQSEAGAFWLDAGDEHVPLVQQGGVWVPLRNRADHPIVEVTWYGAQAYCEWRGARLPTEAEWEKAARWGPDMGESLLYPWGNEPPTPELANFGGARGGTRPVGSYPEGVSPVGAYDMAGNVFEWTADWYAAGAYEASESPTSGERRVLRGGSWGDFGFLLRAANRGQLAPDVAFNFVGFRCVRDP
jgi:formylglycine-generating enzyme required for sulfatase activity